MFQSELTIQTHKKKEIVDITDIIQDRLDEAHIKEGICVVFVSHTTAALTTADLDPGTDLDFLDFLEKVIPPMRFRHPHNPTHTPDHLLSSIIGASLTVPVRQGKLILGVWQKIVLVELAGPRPRSITVSVNVTPGDDK